jgi:hypothetical protein
MTDNMTIQGRILTPEDLNYICALIKDNPGWNRTKISREICSAWNWQTPYGQQKDMACRSMLLKLERRGLIELPPARAGFNNNQNRKFWQPALHATDPVCGKLSDVTPLKVRIVKQRDERELFSTYMNLYHYLGLKTVVGENIQYIIRSRDDIPVACMLFGAAAWKTQPRDHFIGWKPEARKKNLYLIANNHRFLILPWVRIKFLASHILSVISKRLSADWLAKYHHEIVLAETFVECDCFTGTCYKAAGWKSIGETKGRGKDDINNEYKLPVKHVMVYPLCKDFRQSLTSVNNG